MQMSFPKIILKNGYGTEICEGNYGSYSIYLLRTKKIQLLELEGLFLLHGQGSINASMALAISDQIPLHSSTTSLLVIL